MLNVCCSSFGFGNKLFVYCLLLLLQPHSHGSGMCRNPKLDRPALPLTFAKLWLDDCCLGVGLSSWMYTFMNGGYSIHILHTMFCPTVSYVTVGNNMNVWGKVKGVSEKKFMCVRVCSDWWLFLIWNASDDQSDCLSVF